jgi:hypothetical protein
MSIKSISIVSGTALLALTATASAGPMSIASSQTVTPPTQIEQAHYYYGHHYRHYGWHHGWRHYGWNRWNSPYYGYGYGYGYPYYGYGLGTGLAALATAPLAAAAAVTEPLVTGRSVASSGNYCATPVKTCLLYEPGWVGTGCSCRVYGGHERGTVE